MAFGGAPLRESDVDPDPFVQFDRWMAEAVRAERTPEAVAVATVDRDGAPSVRMVLLKAHDQRGLVFSTDFTSRKGRELAGNSQAALLFHWEVLSRQVRIEGTVAKTTDDESDALFSARPRASQLSAQASSQSELVGDRAALEQAVAAADCRFAGRPVDRPPEWGGYRLRPRTFEFWQGRENRLHDRLRYRADGDRTERDRTERDRTGRAGSDADRVRWVLERLQP